MVRPMPIHISSPFKSQFQARSPYRVPLSESCIDMRNDPTEGACSGSILTEACIGLALLVFTWVVVAYHTFMTDNRIRTAMASRHAAWMVAKTPGMDAARLKAEITSDFFYQTNVTVTRDQPVD